MRTPSLPAGALHRNRGSLRSKLLAPLALLAAAAANAQAPAEPTVVVEVAKANVARVAPRRWVPGGVVIAFAVDTTGRIDTSTVLALRATHQQFLNSVQAAVPRMRFEPFSLSGGPDCVLAVQPFLFRFDLTIRY